MNRAEAVIDLSALRRNVEKMHALSEDARMYAVIKANAYGHGAVECARMLEGLPYMEGFAVAAASEALELRNAGIRKEIILLGPCAPDEYEDLIRASCLICVTDLSEARAVSACAVTAGLCGRLLIAVDTGMRRIGFYPDAEGLSEIRKIHALPGISCDGIFTHFARADEYDLASANTQLSLFSAFVDALREAGIVFPLVTASNSAGILTLPEAHFSAVRLGILMYGLLPSDEVGQMMRDRGITVEEVMSLRSRISFIKTVKKGDAVGYGGTYIAPSDRRIATIPVGYADGYPRSLSGKGAVLIRGRRAPITGRICMDQFMVDVTDIPEAAEGDEVVLAGRMGGEEIGIGELAALSGRFNYEFVCLITGRVPRVYI